jgi:hypothetical protein
MYYSFLEKKGGTSPLPLRGFSSASSAVSAFEPTGKYFVDFLNGLI